MEIVEGEERADHGIIFKKVGSELCVVEEGFSTSVPSQALAISNKFGLTFFVHSEGFCLAKTNDLVQASQTSRPSDAAYNAKDKAIADIHLPSTHLIALSEDELVLAACTDDKVNFYNVPALVNKSREGLKNGTVLLKSHSVLGNEECGIKMLAWNPCQREIILLLTKGGNLMLGPFFEQYLKAVAEDVEAADWSPDGGHLCYVTSDRNIHILHAELSSKSSCVLPQDVLTKTLDGNHEAYVDTLKWARLDSILLSCVNESVEDEEENSRIWALVSNAGRIAESLKDAKFVFFEGFFPSIDASILPHQKGSLTLTNFIEPWELLVVTNRMCVDDHISLLGWYNESGHSNVYRCELVDDRYTPRIELQACGDDNYVVGLSVDKTTRSIEIPAPNGDSGEKLKAGPVLFCMTIEGNLTLFSMARMYDKDKNADILNNILELPEANKVLVTYNLDSKLSGNLASIIPGPEQTLKSAEILAKKTSSDFGVGGPGYKSPSLQCKPVSETESTYSQQFPKLPMATPGGANAQNEDHLNKANRLQPRHIEMHSQRQAEVSVSEAEAEFFRELNKVKAMAIKIEDLMSFVEGKRKLNKGEPEPSFTKTSVEEIESKIQNINKQCKHLREQLLEQKQSIADVRDDCLQVDACRVYVQSTIEQASDVRYKDLWSKQTIHPELAAMRKRLLQADQSVKQQIAELDEYLHNLELHHSQKRRQSWNDPALSKSKKFQGLQSLYDTVNTQMAVAQQLARRLAMLSEALKLPAVAKDDMDSLMNTSMMKLQKISLEDPSARARRHSSPPKHDLSPVQATFKSSMETPLKHVSQSGMRAGLQDSTRRRRDSVDKLWFDAGTAKTTVKRIAPAKQFDVLSSPATLGVLRAESMPLKNEPLNIDTISKVTNRSAFHPVQEATELPQRARTALKLVKEETSLSQRSAEEHMKVGSLDTGTGLSLKQKGRQWPTSLATENSVSLLSTSPEISAEVQAPVGPETLSQSNTGQGSQTVFFSNQVTYRSPSSIRSTAQIATQSSISNVETSGNKSISKQDQTKMAPVTTSNKEKGLFSSSGVLVNDLDKKAESPALQSKGTVMLRQIESTAMQPDGNLGLMAKVNEASTDTSKEVNEGQRNKLNAVVENVNVIPSIETGSSNVTVSPLIPDQGKGTSSSPQRELMQKPASLREGSSVLAPTNAFHPATTERPHQLLHFSSSAGPYSSSPSAKTSNLSPFSLVQEASSPSTRSPLTSTSEAVTLPQTSATLHDITISSSKPSNVLNTSYQGEKSFFPATTSPSKTLIPQTVQGPAFIEEEDMEEEDSTLNEFGSSGFAAFGLGSSSPATPQQANPFGLGMSSSSAASKTTSPFGAPSLWSQSGPSSLSVSSGQLFKPASFSIPASPPTTASTSSSLFGNNLTSESANAFNLQGGFGSLARPNAMFGMPSQPGSSAQQALNNALGSFGQTRQIGAPFGASPGPSGSGFGSGGFASAASGAGFASIATSGGFAGVSSGGGFAGVGTGGGFASAATGSGFAGFAGAGIGGSPSSNVHSGGFAAFSGGALPAFGGNTNSSIFTQMRK